MASKKGNSATATEKKERKTRTPREVTPAQAAAKVLARGKDDLAAFDKRIAKHGAAVADLQAKREALSASLASARQTLLAEE